MKMQFYVREILRGFCDVGDFQLRKEHRHRLLDPSSVDFLIKTENNLDELNSCLEQSLLRENIHEIGYT